MTDQTKHGAAPAQVNRWVRLLRWARKAHLWSGIALSLFIVVISTTGFFLLHEKDFKAFGQQRISSALLPAHYAREEGSEALRDVVVDEATGRTLLLGHERAYLMRSRGADASVVAPDAAMGRPRAAAFGLDGFWLAHQSGLARCTADGERCQALRLPVNDQHDLEVTAVSVTREDAGRERIVIALHHAGLFASHDNGSSWDALTPGLSDLMPSPADALHLHALASTADELVVGTGAGLFARTSAGAWRTLGLRGRDVVDLQIGAGDVLWVTTKPDVEGAPGQVLISRDSGMVWQQLEPAQGQPTLKGEARLAWIDTERKRPLVISRGELVVAELEGNRLEPAPLAYELPSRQAKAGVEVAKVMNDLHTGKFFADRLWLVYDLGALSLFLFVVTGLYLWLGPRLVKKQRSGTKSPVSVKSAQRERAAATRDRPKWPAGPQPQAAGTVTDPAQ